MTQKQEKSKFAARDRRGKENEQFKQLAELVPAENAEQLNKGIVVLMCTTDLRLNRYLLGKFHFYGKEQHTYEASLECDCGGFSLLLRAEICL